MQRLACLVLLGLLAVALPYSWMVTGGTRGRAQTNLAAMLSEGADAPLGAAVRALAPKQPLSADLYLVAAVEAKDRNDLPTAERIMLQAIRLDPRLPQARLWMGQQALASGRIEAGVQELAVLLRLRPQSSSAISLLLAQAMTDARARQAVRRILAGNPHLLNVGSAAAARGIPPAQVLGLFAGTDIDALPGGRIRAQEALTEGYFQQKKYGEARSIWSAFLPEKPGNPVFNGLFKDQNASPPFNWLLKMDSDVEAVSVKDEAGPYPSALQVRSFGTMPVVAAEQYLLLPAGRHQLRFAARSADGAKVAWRLNCVEGAPIGELRFAPGSGWKTSAFTFNVPAGCPAQLLRLVANDPPGASDASFLVTAVETSPNAIAD